MNLKTKFKLMIYGSAVLLILSCITAFNNFGINADTIYDAQGNLNASTYNSARGYATTGNTINGVFHV